MSRRLSAIRGERRLQIACAALSSIGIALAAYIAIVESGGGAPTCLAGGSGCKTVANSPYSHLAGVNVAVLGCAGYALLLATALQPGDLGRLGGLFLALVGFSFSIYLTYLELFTIEAICQWCVASAILMTLLLVLSCARMLAYAGIPWAGDVS